LKRYEPQRDGDRLDDALAAAGSPAKLKLLSSEIARGGVRPHPYPFQQRILDELTGARTRHDRHKNLVVAATGTGKTVIAAFDYAQLAKTKGGPLPSLLFVAHRGEILEQSRTTFRSVLGRPEFGEILTSEHPAPRGTHIFANIQSLTEQRLKAIAPDAYEIVVVDEFHHAAAPTYGRLLEHVTPNELLGLTATPERSDGGDIAKWFDGHITSELRLWEAIEQGLLSPFHYFGVDDNTDLSAVRWTRGRYDASELSTVLSGNDARVSTLVTAMNRYVPDMQTMRTLGFCVSIEHAKFMAARFNQKDIHSAMVDGTMSVAARRNILDRLMSDTDSLRCVFSVDVLGEGVDVPDVDTILLLRPTESATVFLQQLGRGLRLSENKNVLTVLDMVGVPHDKFRFDRTLRTIIDPAGGSVQTQAELDFPFLPSGCEIYFERDARHRVLANLRASIGISKWKNLVAELKAMPSNTTLESFLDSVERDAEHVYTGRNKSWGFLRIAAGHATPATSEHSAAREGAYKLLHVDDEERTKWYSDLLSQTEPPSWADLPPAQKRLLDMLLVGLWGAPKNRPSRTRALELLFADADLKDELRQLFSYLGERAELPTVPLDESSANPMRVHARYTKEEALIGYGKGTFEKAPSTMPGVYWVEEENCDCFFVTLRKDEKIFTPETRYHDYAMSPDRFHWETQRRATFDSADAKRYIGHASSGTEVVMLVRETNKTTTGTGEPFTFLGRCQYRSHEDSAPVQIVWDLETPMPAALFEVARLVAG